MSSSTNHGDLQASNMHIVQAAELPSVMASWTNIVKNPLISDWCFSVLSVYIRFPKKLLEVNRCFRYMMLEDKVSRSALTGVFERTKSAGHLSGFINNSHVEGELVQVEGSHACQGGTHHLGMLQHLLHCLLLPLLLLLAQRPQLRPQRPPLCVVLCRHLPVLHWLDCAQHVAALPAKLFLAAAAAAAAAADASSLWLRALGETHLVHSLVQRFRSLRHV